MIYKNTSFFANIVANQAIGILVNIDLLPGTNWAYRNIYFTQIEEKNISSRQSDSSAVDFSCFTPLCSPEVKTEAGSRAQFVFLDEMEVN